MSTSGYTGLTSSFPGTVPRSQALTAVLASMFFGAFTMIVGPALYAVTRKGFGRTSSLAAFATTAALYTVAATYTVAVLVTVFHNTTILDRDHTFYTPTLDEIGTAVLTITAVLSTGVVWSRVWVLWGHNKVLYGVSLVLLMITLILGSISTAERSGYTFSVNNTELWFGGFYWGSETGTGACWMAMCTNTLAFILYLVKVLRQRSDKRSSTGWRIARHFVRILESGTLFAVIWLFVVVYNTGAGDGALDTTDGFSFFVNGALISLLGVCAVLIIVLAATGYSEAALLDGAADDEQGVPLSREK
ncbi:hypothetical protein GSI_05121 [Ganoderma sinense ZZ0214-1]|uniref:Uncharacterized protein n=1 Tax=Ganoderma sinense ZZ0214-1 TaxID=1077348 RepID=A0A2G8SF79_9APHY|nr:hypothetical protein GSI_05121 [Ganoderma sinense ZZ0214-1]